MIPDLEDLNIRDGDIVAVGARADDVNGIASGKVLIYQFNGSLWAQIGNDINGLNQYDQFGQSVSLNNSGDIVAVGANGANTCNKVKNDSDKILFDTLFILSVITFVNFMISEIAVLNCISSSRSLEIDFIVL